jgi:hypothetical protein
MSLRALAPLAVAAALSACRPFAGADDGAYSIVLDSTTVRVRMRRADLPASWTCRALVPPRDAMDSVDVEAFATGVPDDVVDHLVVCPLAASGDPADLRRVYLYEDRVVQVFDQEWWEGDGRAIADTVIGAARRSWGAPKTTTDSSLSKATGELTRTRSLHVEWPTRRGVFAMVMVESYRQGGAPVSLVTRAVTDLDVRVRSGRPAPSRQR